MLAVVTATLETSPTAERLLDAAERLFAERGVDAVSVRAVNAAAGANVAAVHYHFGSKEALVLAVLRRRMDVLGERRRTMLGALPHPPGVRAVVETLVVPLAELSADRDGSGRAYVRFLAMLQGGGPESRALVGAAFADQFGPFDAALAEALPGIPEPIRHFRLGLVGTTVVHTLANAEQAAVVLGRPDRPADHRDVVDALIDSVAGALAAPVPTPGGAP